MNIIKRFLHEKKGNFAVMAGLLAVPVILAAGSALDLSRGFHMKERLNAAADAAVLAAISQQNPAVRRAIAEDLNGQIVDAEETARRVFVGNIQNDDEDMVVSVEPTVIRTGPVFNATVKFSVSLPTTFMSLAGITSMPISGLAEGKLDTTSYQNLYMLIDNSPSMGLAATPNEMARMESVTRSLGTWGGPCAFACHETYANGSPTNRNLISVAEDNNIKIRIDVVAESLAMLMDTARSTRRYPDQFGFGFYSFGTDSAHVGLKEVQRLTRDFDQLETAAGTIKLMEFKRAAMNNYQMTDIPKMMRKLAEIMPAQGDGSSPLRPVNIMFIVSDGVNDAYRRPCPSGIVHPEPNRCVDTISKAVCDDIKEKNIRIAILYTTYFAPYAGRNWNHIAPIKDDIEPVMRDCATPGLFYEVTDGEQIPAAMRTLFSLAVTAPYLTY